MDAGIEKRVQTGVTRVHSPRIAKSLARRAELVAQGKIVLGRPKGVLNAKTIAKIKSKEAFDKAVAERAGLLADDLFRNSRNGDTQAAKVLLEQTFGRARDNSADKLANAAFSLLAFAQRAAQLPKDANADVVKDENASLKNKLAEQSLPHPRPSSED